MERALREAGFRGGLIRDASLARYSTWRIGGPAELFLEPSSVEELSDTLRALWRIGMPFRILGGGSNLLISDRGVRGAVVSLARLDHEIDQPEDAVAAAVVQLDGDLLHRFFVDVAEHAVSVRLGQLVQEIGKLW